MSVGFVVPNVIAWLVACAVEITVSVPQVFDVSQTVIVTLPAASAYNVIPLLFDMPAETALEFESFDM